MGSGPIEQNLADMEVKPTADMALKHKGVIVGIKSAHFTGPEWTPYERAEEVGRIAKIPVMVDFGGNVRAGRTLDDLLTKYFRPGDIFTHMYGGNRGEQDPDTKGPSQAMLDGRKRGVFFDVGHGGSELPLVDGRAADEGGVHSGLDLDRPAHGQHERGDEGHAERHGQVPGDGHVARRCDPALDMEPGEGDSAANSWATSRWGRRPTSRCCGSRRAQFGFVDPRGGRMDGRAEACRAR